VKKMSLILIVLVVVMGLTSCNLPKEAPATEVMSTTTSHVDEMVETPTVVATENVYSNEAFGLSFDYPVDWFGPDEYIVDNTIRIGIGSDVVTSYGGVPLEVPPFQKNAYQVVVQYTLENENTYMNDTLNTLANLQDGEMAETGRSRLIRVRALTVGDYSGYEYIATLSESAQTEYFYVREVILQNTEGNLITILGGPSNVAVEEGANWREVYAGIDQKYLSDFYQIIESLELN
jgi:hypothetical protein